MNVFPVLAESFPLLGFSRVLPPRIMILVDDTLNVVMKQRALGSWTLRSVQRLHETEYCSIESKAP